MTAESVYKIDRYDVRTDHELLIERARLFSRDGMLWRRVDDGPESSCSDADAVAVIGADPVLSEIRANQVTRIAGEPAVLQALPFVLRIPGQRDDFDDSIWSEAMEDEHVTQEWVWQTGMYRVLYVNETRWSAWPTANGERMLPEDWPLIRLNPRWGRLSFCEWGSMVSGCSETVIGLATPSAVACATLIDEQDEEKDAVLWRRGHTARDDGAVFVKWLLEGVMWEDAGGFDEAIAAQLFVDASTDDNLNGAGIPGSRLAAECETRMGWGDEDSSEWRLELNLAPDVIDAVLDVLVERGPRLRDIVTAARDPASPAGIARRAALEEWSESFERQAWQQ
jgi:hypothetical protein